MIDGLHIMPARDQKPLSCEPFHHWSATDGSIWTYFFRIPDGFLLRFPGLADFQLTQDGSKTSCWVVPGTDPATLEHLFLNQVLPLMQSARGTLVFHASAVDVGEGAIAFFGSSGRGKSTLAASFANAGKPFLTDDSLRVELGLNGYEVFPSHPSLRLWDDSQAALGTERMAKAAQVAYTEKARFLSGVDLPHCSEPRPLIAAFFLGEGNSRETVLEPIKGADSVVGWMSNIFMLDVKDKKRLCQSLHKVSCIAETVPSFTLDYPRRYEKLGCLRTTIIAATCRLRESR